MAIKLLPLDYANGIITIIIISIGIFLGLLMIKKYIRYKENTLLFMGLCLICITSFFWGVLGAFISILITGKGLSIQVYFMLSSILSHVSAILWLIAFTNTIYKDKQKLILSFMTVYTVLHRTIFIYFLLVDPSNMGYPSDTPLHFRPNMIWNFVNAIAIIITLITAIIFFKESRKAKDPEIRFKGLFFLLAIVSYCMGIIISLVFSLNIYTLFIVAIIFLSAFLEIYFAFGMPKWFKKLIASD